MASTAPVISIAQAMADRDLLGATLGPDPATWGVWRSVLKGAFALPMTDVEREVFATVAGGRALPEKRVDELWCCVGRRGGKSRIAALISCYLACLVDHSGRLSAGEHGYVLCLSWTLKQAQLVLSYCRAMLEQSPVLAQQIVASNTEEIKLRNNIVIASHPSSFKSVRGRTVLGCVLDEIAMFRVEATSANPDVEVYRAVDHGLMAPEGKGDHGLIVGISTPWGEDGLLYDKFQESFGKDDPEVLYVRGGTRVFNPTQSQARIDRKLKADPEGARSELLAEFRSGLAAYIDRATLELCIEKGVDCRPFEPARRYCGFVDMSGGRHDSSVLAISTVVGERVSLAKVVEVKAPHDPSEVISEFVRVLREFRITTVYGDRYAANWNPSEFRAHNVNYAEANRDKSQLMLDALPIFTSGNALLLDDRRLVEQLCRLRRVAGKSGKDRVEKRDGDFDDRANAVCGSLVYALEGPKRPAMPRVQAHQGLAGYNVFTGGHSGRQEYVQLRRWN